MPFGSADVLPKGVTPLDLVTWAFAAYITWSMIAYLASGELKIDFMVFRTLRNNRWRLLLFGIPALIVTTIGLALLLYQYGGPVLQFSWTMLIATTKAEKESGGSNLMVGGLKIPIFAALFIPLLALNIPRLAKREERVFRQGVRSPKQAAIQSIQFGLMHCVVGVPVAVGLALTWPGLVFCYLYSKGGVRYSTAWHAVYNWTILTLALSYILVSQKK